MTHGSRPAAFDLRSTQLEQALFEVRRVIVGQDRMLERLIVALVAGGHVLLEGVPGLAKTLTLSTLARVLGGSFARISFTPDLIPADIVGTRIYRASQERFDVEPGPVFVNFLLADEINRAPAKVQSALLEVMQENQVTIGGRTFEVPIPFLVMATQNPIESEGVYPLPEAQRDRFLMRVPVDYPTAAEEAEIVRRAAGRMPEAAPILDPSDVTALQNAAEGVFVDRAVSEYAISLVLATRDPLQFGFERLEGLLAYGASPRASIGLVRAARALALLRGRAYALPQDVYDVAYDVLNHRVVLSYDALADGVTVDDVIVDLLATFPAPHVALREPAPVAPVTETVGAQTPAASPADETAEMRGAEEAAAAERPVPPPAPLEVGTPATGPTPPPGAPPDVQLISPLQTEGHAEDVPPHGTEAPPPASIEVIESTGEPPSVAREEVEAPDAVPAVEDDAAGDDVGGDRE